MAQDNLKYEVFQKKYALRDEHEMPLETDYLDMHKRLAKEFSRIENKYPNPMSYDEILELLQDFKYVIPQGSPMYGIGNKYSTSSLSNCFVIGNEEDTISGIFHVDEMLAQLIKQRAGNGVDLSHLRPRGSPVNNASKTSTGPINFAAKYSDTTRNTAQDGRRGALMLTMRVDHPDIEEFINCKQDLTRITGANISVKLTDEFINAVKQDRPYTQWFGQTGDKGYVRRDVSAKKIWDKITYNAWNTGEPGALFWDRILRESPADCYEGFITIATNPCGEVPLCAYDSCRLIANNLYSYVVNKFRPDAYFDLELFKTLVRKSMRLMDDLVDLEEEKVINIITKIKSEKYKTQDRVLNLWESVLNKLQMGRRTGLGITGLGDVIAAVGLAYGSQECSDLATLITKTMALTAYKTSVELARERGAFPLYDSAKDANSEFIKRICAEDPQLAADMQKYGRRNIAILSIAPTGTVSLMTETTSGIEPVFAVYYKRNRKINHSEKIDPKLVTTDANGDKWVQYCVLHKPFLDWMEVNNHTCDLYNTKQLNTLIEKSPYFGSTANDINYIAKVQMQGRIQQWIDHSISVTINLPNSTPVKKVREIYMAAWISGCKGCTVYRDGSRSGVLVSADSTTNEKKEMPKKRPATLDAKTIYFTNRKVKWMAFIGFYNDKPYEIFTGPVEVQIPASVTNCRIEKRGTEYYFLANTKQEPLEILVSKCFDCHYWNYAKIISKLLRAMDLLEVIEFIKGLKFNEEGVNTWHAGVIRALSKYMPNGTKSNKLMCVCGSSYTYQEGCLLCYNCGNSKCG